MTGKAIILIVIGVAALIGTAVAWGLHKINKLDIEGPEKW